MTCVASAAGTPERLHKKKKKKYRFKYENMLLPHGAVGPFWIIITKVTLIQKEVKSKNLKKKARAMDVWVCFELVD